MEGQTTRIMLPLGAAAVLLFLATAVLAQQKTAEIETGGHKATVKGTVDTGATDGDGNGHPSEIDRKTAKDLGILDANGNPDPNKFEKDPCDPNQIMMDSFHIADCSHKNYGITKPVKIKIADDTNEVKEVNIPVTVALDPCSKGSNLFGEDWMRRVSITIKFLPKRVITFDNNETNVPGGAPMPEPNRSSIPDGRPRRFWPASIDDKPIDAFVGMGSPYTIVPRGVAYSLGLTLAEENVIDLSGEENTLYYLWRIGFMPMSNGDGKFYVEHLDRLRLFTPMMGVTIQYENIEVLVPYGYSMAEPTGILLGTELLQEQAGCIYRYGVPTEPVGQITFIGSLESWWFSPASPAGDLNKDLRVDFKDFYIFAVTWLEDTRLE